MSEEFTLQYRPQQEWGWLAVLDFFLAGGGAGLYLLGIAFGFSQVLPVGLIAAAIGALLLLADLGRPERFWRAISRPGTSWISRGIILVTLFLIFGTLSVVSIAPPGGSPSSGTRDLIVAIAALTAVGVTAYTGFLLADSPGVPAWHSALMPVQFVILSLLTGIGGFFLLLPMTDIGLSIRTQGLEWIGLGLCLATLLMLSAYLISLRSSSPAARQAQEELTRGRFATAFVGGGWLLGIVVPIIILAYLLSKGGTFAVAPEVSMLVGALLVAGGLLIRYCLLKVGYYAPVVEPLVRP